MWYRRFRSLWPLAAAALLVMTPVESSLARLYKWVDDYGNVTYSERKPPGQQVEEIKVRAAPVSPEQAQEELDSLKEKANSSQKDRDVAKTAAREDQQESEAFKKNCEIAQQNRRVLENSARVQSKDTEGNSYFLDSAEIQAKLEQSNKQIELYCK
ncbi:MAG: DUF4124 domain-containing protein [Gammaproteobacteria bacterium]|nr:DUF4124 domain-containing protein [Gammaproteobacteria bacterium]